MAKKLSETDNYAFRWCHHATRATISQFWKLGVSSIASLISIPVGLGICYVWYGPNRAHEESVNMTIFGLLPLIVFVVASFVCHFLRTPAKLETDLRKQLTNKDTTIRECNSRIDELEAELKRLNTPCVTFCDDEIKAGEWQHHFRIPIKNGKVPQTVRVKLESLTPAVPELRDLPIPLCVMDHDASIQVSLNSDEQVWVDVFQLIPWRSDPHEPTSIRILDAKRRNDAIPFRRYEVTIAISANTESAVARRKYVFNPTSETTAEFHPLDDQQPVGSEN